MSKEPENPAVRALKDLLAAAEYTAATAPGTPRGDLAAPRAASYRAALAKLEEPEVQDSPEPRTIIKSYTGLGTAKLGTRAVDGQGFTVRRVVGGWRYETSAAAGLFRHYEMEAHLPLLVVEQVAPDEGTPPAPRVPSRVIGRVMWDAAHPSPWVSFDNITAYTQWGRDMRRELPGIRTQLAYLDHVHTAESLLSSARGKREELNRG